MSDKGRAHDPGFEPISWDEAFQIIGEKFRDIRPASTLIVCGLVREELLIEIEVTAKLPE